MAWVPNGSCSAPTGAPGHRAGLLRDSDCVEIRKTGEDDWERLRDVRLRALADAPHAFGSTFDLERGRAEAGWREWAGRGRHGSGATFVAVSGEDPGRFVGLAAGFEDDEEGPPGSVHLVSMWVDPAVRHQGLGRGL